MMVSMGDGGVVESPAGCACTVRIASQKKELMIASFILRTFASRAMQRVTTHKPLHLSFENGLRLDAAWS